MYASRLRFPIVACALGTLVCGVAAAGATDPAGDGASTPPASAAGSDTASFVNAEDDERGPEPEHGWPPGPAPRGVCLALGAVGWVPLQILSAGHYDWRGWSRERRMCWTMIGHVTAGVAGAAIDHFAHPRTPPMFGAGSFDRYFRDRWRTDATNNFFDEGVGRFWSPIFTSVALLGTTGAVANADIYYDTVARALPLLWVGSFGIALPREVAKKGIGRRRPYVRFDNEKAIRDFGTGDDSRESFYSGHVTTAFYTAAFADRVMADVIATAYPGYSLAENPLVRLGQGLALYGLAAGISYSRIAIDRHYMTDVLAGAGVGLLAGQLTYTYGYKKPRTGHPVTISAMPGARGLQVSWQF